MLPGTKHPDETVLYTAHWDHLGVGLPDAKGDRIYNGAVDNAAGVAALLELARAFAKAPRTDRTVVFMAVTAEEKGLLGSEYYASHPLYPLATTVGDINMDALRDERPGRGHLHLRRQQGRPAGRPGRGRARRDGRYFTPDAGAGGRALLPLRPLLLRQARRAGDLASSAARTC